MDILLLEPRIWVLIIILTLLGTTFSLAKYSVGNNGFDAILDRFPILGRERLERFGELYDQHGSMVLLLAAIPGIDTIVSTVAGAIGINRTTFILWITTAKLIRFWLIALVLTGAINLINR